MSSGQISTICYNNSNSNLGHILFFPAMAGFLLLVIHSLIKRGWADTLRFMVPIFIYGFIHEKSSGSPVDPAEYMLGESLGIQVGGVPLIIPIGWTFAIYLGLCAAEKLTAAHKRFRGNLFAMLGVSLWTVFFISMSVETVGAKAGWWTWRYGVLQEDIWLFCTPKFVFINWSFTALMCSLPYFLMWKSRFKTSRFKYFFILLYTYPFLGRIVGGPVHNYLVFILLFLFMFVFPFTSRFELE